MTPKLTSQRLVLIPYEPDLIREDHINWLNDKDLMRFSEQRHFTHTLKSQLLYVRDPDPNRMLWLIKTLLTNRPPQVSVETGQVLPYKDGDVVSIDIGTISAHIDPYNEHANLGILIGRREYHGLGFGAEAWRTVMDFLLENGMHKVEAGCREDNHAMRRIAVTTGMDLEATVPQHFKGNGHYIDLCLYGKFKTDYLVNLNLRKATSFGTYAA